MQANHRIQGRGLIAWLIGLCVLLSGAAHAHLIPQGGETLLTLTTVESQIHPVYTYSRSGSDRIAVWSSEFQDGDGFGIFARFNGIPLEIQINETTLGNQTSPHVSISDAGSVVFIWTGEDQGDTSIYARIFDNAGGPLTPEFLVEGQSGDQMQARVDHFPNGNFIVAWSDVPSLTTTVRVFEPGGNPLIAETGASVLSGQADVDVSAGPNDFAIVTWRASGVDEGVYYRVIDPSGNWLSNPTQANETSANFVTGSAASSSIGTAFVAWLRYNWDGTQTVLVRPIDGAGVPLAPETEVHTASLLSANGLSMTHDGKSRGAIVWQQGGGAPDVAIQCLDQEYPVGLPTVVNTTTDGTQRLGSVGTDGGGRFTVAWYSLDAENGVDQDCFIQHYDLDPSASTDAGANAPMVGLKARGVPTVFSHETSLRYDLATPSHAEAAIFDVHGRRVRSLPRGTVEIGTHSMTWNGRDDAGRLLPAGTYWFQVRAGGSVAGSRLVIVR